MNRSKHVGWLVVVLLAFASAAFGDSLFSRDVQQRGTLISDMKIRFEEGDLITILVEENVDARTDSELETERESALSASTPAGSNETFTGQGGFNFFKPGELPNWDISVESEHEAEGTTRRRNRLTTTVSCVVTKVLANGNVHVEGQKRVTVNREDTLLMVSGIVRARDVTAENTVASGQMANAVIELKGQGPLWNNQRRGFFTKLLDWISPF